VVMVIWRIGFDGSVVARHLWYSTWPSAKETTRPGCASYSEIEEAVASILMPKYGQHILSGLTSMIRNVPAGIFPLSCDCFRKTCSAGCHCAQRSQAVVQAPTQPEVRVHRITAQTGIGLSADQDVLASVGQR